MANPPKPDIGKVPFTEAFSAFERRLKNKVGTKYWDDMVGHAHAQSFTVAGATKAELLNDFGKSIADIQKAGGTLNDFRKEFDTIVAKHGWSYNGARGWRTRVIFETNMRTSYAAGRWQQVEKRASREKKKGRELFLIYDTARDERVRDAHDNWRDIVRPVNDEFWITHYPPNGWGCRCIARTASESYLKSRKLDSTPDNLMPEIQTEDRINTRTGEVYKDQIPGIDTGWNYNVGQRSLFPDPNRMEIPELGHEVAKLSVSSPNFKKLFNGSTSGSAPVGFMESALSEALNVNTKKVVISGETLKKQRTRHPDLSIEEYQIIPDMIANGLVVQEADQTLVFFRSGGKLYRSVVKRIKGGNELVMTTFHRSTQRQLTKERQSGKVIREEK